MDASAWVDVLRREGNGVFTLAEAIVRSFGGLRFGGPPLKRGTRHDFEVNPDYWYDMRDHIELVEEAVGRRVCPLGITTGAAMLAILEDGRVISEFPWAKPQGRQCWPSFPTGGSSHPPRA